MTELSDKQAKLVKLKNIKSSGVSAVRSGDDRVDYRSMTEIDQAISALEAEIADLEGATPRRRVRYIYQTGKGY